MTTPTAADIAVRRGDAAEPGAAALLEAYWAYIAARFPPAANFALDHEGLRQPSVTFFIAERSGAPIGCAAYSASGVAAAGDAPWGEVKSMYVAPDERGHGVADALLSAVEAAAVADGCNRLFLETGDVLHAAQAFYARRGFEICGPFGDYPADPQLVFMTKPLSATAG